MAIDDTQTSPSTSGEKDKPGHNVPETSLLTYPHLRGISIAFVLMGIMMHT
ncbi:MAG: hypothetical protein COB70_005240, partial [Rhodobiaceae bacterium]|nr:hypothetical protein [Rhodobiaceae bacterium]